jgi:hypothetical protein
MATFTSEVFQNEFLPDGGTDVHAIVRVTCSGAGQAGAAQGAEAAEIVIVDTSGSMSGNGIAQGRYAASVALNEITDGTWFAVIAGNHVGALVYPAYGVQQMVRMDGRTRAEAIAAVQRFKADGGTAMGHVVVGQGGLPRVPHVRNGTRSCSPTAPTSTRRPTSSPGRSRRAPGSSRPTAAASGIAGRSMRSAGSPRRCSARST